MAKIDIKVPSPGESITEVTISRWVVSDGDYVEKDQELAEIESDKAILQTVIDKLRKRYAEKFTADEATIRDLSAERTVLEEKLQ